MEMDFQQHTRSPKRWRANVSNSRTTDAPIPQPRVRLRKWNRHGRIVRRAHVRPYEGLSGDAIEAIVADNAKRKAWRDRSATLLASEANAKGGVCAAVAVDIELSAKHVADELAKWIDSANPEGFVTIPMPITDESRARPHSFYLKLWALQAERALWGTSAQRVRNPDDRLRWFFVKEKKADGMVHWHAACCFPKRPMKIERERGMLPLAERCALLQRTLIRLSKRTPQPYRQHAPGAMAQREVERHVGAGSSLLHDMRGNDIQVIPFEHPHHANYMVKQRPLTRDDPDRLFILQWNPTPNPTPERT